MPPDPPLPVTATASTATKVFVVTFDKPLVPGVFDRFNWSANVNLGAGVQLWIPGFPTPPVALGNTLTWGGTVAGAAIGPPVLFYTPPPFDIVGLNGLPVAPFSGFPVTIIP